MTSTTSTTADPREMTPQSNDTPESRVAAMTKIADAPKRTTRKNTNSNGRTAPKRNTPTAAPKVAPKTVKSDGPGKTQITRILCARMMVALKNDSSKISDAALRKLGVTREQYVAKIAELCDYFPVALADWDVAYFGHKEGRGGRPTTRVAAPVPTPKKTRTTARKPK